MILDIILVSLIPINVLLGVANLAYGNTAVGLLGLFTAAVCFITAIQTKVFNSRRGY